MPLSEGEALAERVEVGIALPHELVPRGRIVDTAEVPPEARDQLHGLA
jgi:hypothetical protein